MSVQPWPKNAELWPSTAAISASRYGLFLVLFLRWKRGSDMHTRWFAFPECWVEACQ